VQKVEPFVNPKPSNYNITTKTLTYSRTLIKSIQIKSCVEKILYALMPKTQHFNVFTNTHKKITVFPLGSFFLHSHSVLLHLRRFFLHLHSQKHPHAILFEKIPKSFRKYSNCTILTLKILVLYLYCRISNIFINNIFYTI